MWKNHTTPNIHSSAATLLQVKGVFCDMSFADTEPVQFRGAEEPIHQIGEESSLNLNSGEDILCGFRSKGSSGNQELANQFSCELGGKLTKEQMIMLELEKNQELRINLFKAEKTIDDLSLLFRNMQQKILKTLNSCKSESDHRIGQSTGFKAKTHKSDIPIKERQINTNEKIRDKSKQKQRQRQREKQNRDDREAIKKQAEIAEIWKNCYTDLIQYINGYTKDLMYMIEQYKKLEAEKQAFRNKNKKSKKNEQNLLKILKESNHKLHKSEIAIEKAIEDINERDRKIEEYQIENKNIKMKIMEYLEEIERLKRENKTQIRQTNSYKEVAKTMQDQIRDNKNKMEQLHQQVENKSKMEEIYKENEKALKERLVNLEDELKETRFFNENVIDEYKKLSSKVCQSEEKLNQKCQGYEKIYEQRIRQYEKTIVSLKREKEGLVQKNRQKFEIIEKQLEKTYKIKAQLEKEAKQSSQTISQLNQNIGQLKQHYIESENEVNTILKQKDIQIQQLYELLGISNQKVEVLKLELQEVTADMLLMIQQLKVKEMEVKKLQTLYGSDIDLSYEEPKEQRKLEKIGSGRIHKNVVVESFSDSANKNDGMVWKKMKKEGSSSIFEPSSISHESGPKDQQQDRISQFTLNRTTQKSTQTQFDQSNEVPQLLKLYECEFEAQNVMQQPVSPKFHLNGSSSKNKFNLLAFQNKLVLQENAKTLFKLNRTVFR